MMGTLRRATAPVAQTANGHATRSRPLQADARLATSPASGSPLTTFAERVRTFVDRTLDAARGRFDC